MANDDRVIFHIIMSCHVSQIMRIGGDSKVNTTETPKYNHRSLVQTSPIKETILCKRDL